MSDTAAIVLAVAVWVGATIAAPVPMLVAGGIAAGGLALRRPVVLVIGGALVASTLGASAWRGLEAPPSRALQGVGVVLSDPVSYGGAVRVDIRLHGRRYEAWAHGAAAEVLRPRLTGELVRLRGRRRAPPASARDRLAVRHIASRLDVDAVSGWRPGNVVSTTANGLRRTLTRGASSLDDDQRSLLLGVVLGDDRDQDDELRDAFRGSGLSHLLAVSGTNVALVMTLAGPVLRRLGLRGRWLATLLLLAFFGLLTRWEPSVIRAGVMAALACTASTLGRPASRLRLLALAVACAVVVDPFLVRAIGFQLSVAATAGIALLAGPLANRLPGPRWLAETVAMTTAAQVGVAPVALPAFGGLPLAALPANVLAAPVAAPLTAWGLTGGLLAGIAGAPFDEWLHLPTRLLTGWLAGVARWGAALPLGQLGARHAVAVAVAAVIVGGGRRWWRKVGSARWSWPWDRTASTSPHGRS